MLLAFTYSGYYCIEFNKGNLPRTSKWFAIEKVIQPTVKFFTGFT